MEMTYQVEALPHQCVLPAPGDFPEGTEIKCTEPRFMWGKWEECGERYWRRTGWSKEPYWRDKWGEL